ncbi:MAG: RecX family transcriptional regulator [Bacteroidales bacterium]|jgi:regulatory protein|nr:RecX family transcriptional regulator [Bacteroidales bacterium]
MEEKPHLKTALTKAMQICSRQEYCISDIEKKLEQWEVSKPDMYEITDILQKENFINEERYATAFAKDKFNYNKWGKIKIASHMKIKKIPMTIIDMALDSIDSSRYITTLETIIKTHRKSVKAKNSYELKAKLMRFGLSRGFESSLLYELLGNIDDDGMLP